MFVNFMICLCCGRLWCIICGCWFCWCWSIMVIWFGLLIILMCWCCVVCMCVRLVDYLMWFFDMVVGVIGRF